MQSRTDGDPHPLLRRHHRAGDPRPAVGVVEGAAGRGHGRGVPAWCCSCRSCTTTSPSTCPSRRWSWTAVGIGIGAGVVLAIATAVFKLVETPVARGARRRGRPRRPHPGLTATEADRRDGARRPPPTCSRRTLAPRGGARRSPNRCVRCSGEMPVDEAAWAFEVKWDGVRALGSIRDGELRPAQLERQRHHDPLPGAGRRRGPADGPLGRARRRGRAPRRERSTRLRDAPGPHAPDQAGRDRQAGRRPPRSRGSSSTCSRSTAPTPRRLALRGPPPPARAARSSRGRTGRCPPAEIGEGPALLDVVRQRGLEGVMAKKLGSPYDAGQALDELAQDQGAPAARSSWSAGGGGAATAATGPTTSGRCSSARTTATASSTPAGSGRAHPGRDAAGTATTSPRAPGRPARSIRRPPGPSRRTRCGSSPTSWSRWPSASGPTRIGCATPSYLGRRDDKDPRAVVHERIRPGDAG